MTIAEQLRRDEGSRNFPYVDTMGKITIGVGYNLTDNGLPDSYINDLLQDRIQIITKQINDRLPYFQTLDPVRQGVLINMGYNLGFGGLEKFANMLTAFAKGDWDTAASEMLNSAWAGQVKDRAMRLAEQTKTGIWT